MIKKIKKIFLLFTILSVYSLNLSHLVKKKNLYVSFYIDNNSKRHAELEEALIRNIKNERINKIYVILEGSIENHLFKNTKIDIINIKKRPTYLDFFEIINKTTNEHEISILANSDIYFDDTLYLLDFIDFSSRCIALTCWDVIDENKIKFRELNDSQDAWIFEGKIKPTLSNFFLGIPGCDNKLAYELDKVGYNIINPSRFIISYHLHLSNSRNYKLSDRLPGPYKLVPISDMP